MKLNLSLKIDVDANIEDAIAFLKNNKDNHKMLSWFSPEDIQYLLNGKFSEKEQKKIIEAYARSIYVLRKKEIDNRLKEIRKDWGKMEKKYLAVVEKIFGKHPWPKGQYIGYVSIFNMYPRNIGAKTFFFPYIHHIPQKYNEVIAHEMLHFIFFDYMRNMYGINENFKFKNKPEEYVWEVSEVFNNVIEDWKPYQDVVRSKPFLYHGKVSMFNDMKKQWGKKQDIKWLLDQWLLPIK